MNLNYTGKHGELNFEKDFITKLQEVGWEHEIINHPTEQDLIQNWKDIIFENNKGVLNDIPLSEFEMNQIMEYVSLYCNTPVKANLFISGKDICIKREISSLDTENAGKEIYLNIFSHTEIAGGRTRYQIVEQPIFKTSEDYENRRGDVMLLINGIPVIHIELKASGIPLEQATNQIQKYAKEGVFTGLFSLIQVFFAITPEDAIYFSNPGEVSKYNSSFFFHWGDKMNEEINDWKSLCKGENAILSIPEAHQLISYYTVASKSTDSLIVLRSYQYYAIRAILQRVKHQNWDIHDQLGGYVWCTTGGGKTLTSFKTGQMIIDKGLADKVIFVVDRVELNNQSLEEYNSFQRDGEEVQETTSSYALFVKLKSKRPDDSLIVTSIQKLSNINDECEWNRKADLEYIKTKRIVFIIDEAHRSQFGSMHERVKSTFTNALFIGFTGTPIFSTDTKTKRYTTETVFGKCLSIYSIADGIRDKNVLGFSPFGVQTYKESELREQIGLRQCNAKNISEIINNPERFSVYKKYQDMSMGPTFDDNGKINDFIESYLPTKQYDNDKHRNAVIDNILEHWLNLSHGRNGTKFHAILAASSIPEACRYYQLFKERKTDLKISVLFDPNIDNSGIDALNKEDALIEIIHDYNEMYDKHFNRDNDPNYKNFKQDVIARLSHKKQYKYMDIKGDENTLDIIIVVDQLLTGFDSKFVNTLYLDKMLEEDNLIQAISRTNRIYNEQEKPFGIFKFYRRPYTMKFRLDNALKLYCEGKPDGVIVNSLEENIQLIIFVYQIIEKIFAEEKIDNFCRLPDSKEGRNKFRKEFHKLYFLMNSVFLQGFEWFPNCKICKLNETCTDKELCPYKLPFDENIYLILMQRYKDYEYVIKHDPTFGYDIPSFVVDEKFDTIDKEYLEKHFRRVIPIITSNETSEFEKDDAIKDFEDKLPSLSKKQQDYAKRIINDIRDGVLIVGNSTSLMQYISQYQENDLNQLIHNEAELFGLDEGLLKDIYLTSKNERELNEYNRFETLKNSADFNKVISYFEEKNNKKYSLFTAKIELHKVLKDFILKQ